MPDNDPIPEPISGWRKPSKKKNKFWGTVKLLAQLKFGDAVEYANDGDTEN